MRLDQWLEKERRKAEREGRRPLSESEAARRLGIAQSALNRMTFHRLPPTLRNAAKIVRGTNAEVGYEDLLGQAFLRNLWRYDGKLSTAPAA